MTRTLVWLTLAALALPALLTLPLALSPGPVLAMPAGELSLRWLREVLSVTPWPRSLGTTVWVAALAALVAMAVGVPMAIGLEGRAFRGRALLSLLVALPLAVPGVLLGVGMLALFQTLGVWGSPAALGLALAVPALPVVVLLTRQALREVPPDLALAARGLGATPTRAALAVTLPLVAPTIAGAAGLAFLLALNEAIVTQFLARPPDSETLAKVVWPKLRYSLSPAVAAASAVLLLVTLVGVGVALLGRAALSGRHPRQSS